jgi:hypothetical protein
VTVAISPIMAGQNVVDGVQEVGIAPGTGLDDRNTCGCMGDEDVQQAVSPIGDEPGRLGGNVEDASLAPGLDREDLGIH